MQCLAKYIGKIQKFYQHTLTHINHHDYNYYIVNHYKQQTAFTWIKNSKTSTHGSLSFFTIFY